jgi:desulfoferrodoxin (superoxide reductase-like protein)
MMVMKLIRFVMTIIGMIGVCTIFSLSCTDSGDFPGIGKGKTVQKFYSAEDPGRWEPLAKAHDVKVAIIEDAKGVRAIEASVPFTRHADERHYVQVLAVLDESLHEVASVKFKPGEWAHAIFPMTGPVRLPVWVVAKCNMHDMWRKKVTGKEKPKQEVE